MESFANLQIIDLLMVGIPLLLIEGVFAGSEIALLSADRLRLKKTALSKTGSAMAIRGSQLALRLLDRSENILAVTLLVTSVCVITISALVAIFVRQQFGPESGLLAIAITSPIIVLLGEFLPKTLYQRHADRIARWVSFPIQGSYYLLYPITRLLGLYTARLTRTVAPLEVLFTGRKRTTRDELKALVSYGRKESELAATEKEMIGRILEFKDSDAKSALIPLVDVDAISQNLTVEQALREFQKFRHSRMPVFSKRVDNIIGILEVSDLLSASDPMKSIAEYITPAHYVAESQSLDSILSEMQREKSQMTTVVDEHGGAVGILTFEDIAEEIVGEIYDEYDFEKLPYRAIQESTWVVQARVEIEQLNESLKIQLPEGDYETLSGFLLEHFGRIPKAQDETNLTTPAGTFRVIVLKATERRIDEVRIERAPKSEDESSS